VLNHPVDDIEAAVEDLGASGVEFEQYDEGSIANEKGIAEPGAGNRPGPRNRPATSCPSSG
ncbi:MAG: hypothetical protein ACRDVG_03165, partial [Jatrophihabitantaceae bacterium]